MGQRSVGGRHHWPPLLRPGLDTSLTIDSRALRGGDPLESTIRTVIESPTFQRQAAKLWSEDERLDFIDWTGHERQGLATPPLRLR